MSLVQRSLCAGALIALTALLRASCRGRLPRRMYIALWDLAALRLLVPLSLPWAYAPRALLRAVLAHGQEQTAQVQQIAYTAAAVSAQTSVTDMPAQGAAALPWGSILWLTGALLLAAHFLRAYVVSLRAFGESLPDDAPQTAAILKGFPLRRHVRVRVSDRIGAPLSYGVLRPVILLPRGMDRSGDTLYHVLLHELEHIRALDAARKLLLTACVCVHWFNPLVWIMFLLANRDMELLCDARVLARLGRASRRNYAMTLLALEARRSGLSPLASGFSMTAIEERMTAMKNMKKMSAASVLLAALLVLCAGAALATDAPKDRIELIIADGEAKETPLHVYAVSSDGASYTIQLDQTDTPDIVWWTAEEYEDYVAQQRKDMAQLVAEGARAWTNQDGWFVWTQEKMDEVMAIYEQTLSEIRSGAHVSKTVNGSDDVVIHESLCGSQALSLILDNQRTSVYIQSDGGEAGK
ncbi:MAG: M56 family metallopeptidase [Clostridia bacterium]|nr:M56 family metallopeptidase [Clostridia bacterium]